MTMAKRIKEAFIQQVIEFDEVTDYEKWLAEMEQSKFKYRIDQTKQDGHIITVTVMKQYNKNYFPFEER